MHDNPKALEYLGEEKLGSIFFKVFASFANCLWYFGSLGISATFSTQNGLGSSRFAAKYTENIFCNFFIYFFFLLCIIIILIRKFESSKFNRNFEIRKYEILNSKWKILHENSNENSKLEMKIRKFE